MTDRCAEILVGVFVAYGLLATVVSLRLPRYWKDGIPLGMAALKGESYTPEGQRLLHRVRWLALGVPVLMVLLFFLGALACS